MQVTPGEDGRQDFEEQIREIYGLGPEVGLQSRPYVKCLPRDNSHTSISNQRHEIM